MARIQARLHRRLEHVTQNVCLAETAVPVLRECGVIWDRIFEPEPAKPAIGQVEADQS